MTLVTAFLVMAVLYLWHRVARLESRLRVRDRAHGPGPSRRLVEVLFSGDSQDVVTFVNDSKSPAQERAEVAVGLLEMLQNGSLSLTPEARGRVAASIGELLRTDAITTETRARLVGSVDLRSTPRSSDIPTSTVDLA